MHPPERFHTAKTQSGHKRHSRAVSGEFTLMRDVAAGVTFSSEHDASAKQLELLVWDAVAPSSTLLADKQK
jgi:hypothetical protein